MQRQGYSPNASRLLELTDQRNWSDVIEAIFRYYTDASDPEIIWGDKSPKHLFQMELLRRHFPTSKFVHIFRDPRDRALSARRAWKANLLIASHQWLKGMQHAARFQESEDNCYHAVRYESLVTDTEGTMQKICQFIEVTYSTDMLTLNAPIENRGDMSNPTRISSAVYAGNIGNFREHMTYRQLQRIEEIVFPIAMKLGYVRETKESPHRPLQIAERIFWTLPHYWGGMERFVQRWGIFDGFMQAWARYRQ